MNIYLSMIIINIIHDEWFMEENVIIFFIDISLRLMIVDVIDDKILIV